MARTMQLAALGAGIAIAAQVIASWLVVRRATDRVAAANGLALCSLAVASVAVATSRAWFAPPHVDVPSPFWMVAVPAIDLAAAACAIATVLALILAAARRGRFSS